MDSILIADDDSAEGAQLATLLAQVPGLDLTDIKIVKSATATAAISKLSAASSHVVIVALRGHGTRALSLCQVVRQSQCSDATHIAVVGAKIPDPEVLRQLEKVFTARFFAKPFELSQLGSYVANSLGRPSAQLGKSRPITSFGTGEQGELAIRRLAAVLLDFFEQGESGLLHLQRGKIRKTISISKGLPVSVRSATRDETLGQFLLNQEIITSQMHREAIRKTATSKKRIGEVLVDLGAINQSQLVAALTAQLRFKIFRALRWPDGQWHFEPRMDVADSAAVGIDLIRLVVGGLKEGFKPNLQSDLHRDLMDRPIEFNARGVRMQKAWKTEFASDLSAGMATPGSTFRGSVLIERGLTRTSVLEFVDTLWHCDAISILEEENRDQAIERQGDRSRHTQPISVAELAARSQRARDTGPDGALWDLLWGDSVTEFSAGPKTGSRSLLEQIQEPAPEQAASKQAAEEITQVTGEFDPQRTVAATKSTPSAILDFHLRFQGNDYYKIVGADIRSEPDQLERAIARTEAKLARAGILGSPDETLSAVTSDVPLAQSVRRSFKRARDVLLDPKKRAHYDRERRESLSDKESDPIRAELAYGRALEAMDKEAWPIAVRELHTAVDAAPDEASYRAALGWSHYLKGGCSARAADQARPHLNNALAIDYDHAAAHEYKGLIGVALGTDETEAIFHLTRALDVDPSRTNALSALETIYERRGELRRLERLYRSLLAHLSGRSGGTHSGKRGGNAEMWMRLGRLYKTHLDDDKSAAIAFKMASELASSDPEIAELAAELSSGGPTHFAQLGAELVNHWLNHPLDAGPGRKLHALAFETHAFDHAFIVASSLVAIGGADDAASETYRRFRPRFVVRSQRPISGALWDELCDEADNTLVAELLSLLAPAIYQLSPMTLDDLEVSPRDILDDERLPPIFARIRDYVAHTLQVPSPQLYHRTDFAGQIHVGGLEPAVLLVGDDILEAPERLELAFRLGRAMSYLRPGRALGGSHSGTLLRQVVLAAFYVTHSGSSAPEKTAVDLAQAIAAVERLDSAARHRLRELVDATSQRSQNLNLTEWKNSLARTANRVGLVLCGDVPAALRFTADNGGSQAVSELLRFIIGGSFAKIRSALGLSIDI